MKRTIYVLAIFTVICLSFTGCSKDDDQSLVGTSWETINDNNISTKLTFWSKIDCQIVVSNLNKPSDYYVTNFTYVREDTGVWMYPKPSNVSVLRGIINGRKMSVINVSTGKSIYDLTKL